jgi:hypothetical protein
LINGLLAKLSTVCHKLTSSQLTQIAAGYFSGLKFKLTVYFGWIFGRNKSARKIDDGDVDEDDGFLNDRKRTNFSGTPSARGRMLEM